MPKFTFIEKDHAVKISETEIRHPLIYEYFKSISVEERNENFPKALFLGVLALNDDRFASFLSKTENELGTHLEALKLIYQIKAKEYATTAVGATAEEGIFQAITTYLSERGFASDKLENTGAVGGMSDDGANKTGDFIIDVEGKSSQRIVIESKFQKGIALGEFEQSSSLERGKDTAISQMIESAANRGAQIAMIVFDRDKVDNALEKSVKNISWRPGIGFVVIIDHTRGDYSNLYLALDLARGMVKATLKIADQDILESLIGRISRDLSSILETEKLLKANHENLKKISESIRTHSLLVNFTKTVLESFISKGEISHPELLEIYRGEGLRPEFAEIKKEVKSLFPSLADNREE